MKKLIIGSAVLAVCTQANAAPSVQGYYQAKELITYTTEKIQQNKAEFFMLDFALTKPAQSQPLWITSNDALGYFQANNTDVNEDEFTRILTKVSPNGLQDQSVCRVDSQGTQVAYFANGRDNCSEHYEQQPMAMSKKGNKVSFMRRWDFDNNQPHFDIQSYDYTDQSETLTLDYLLQFEGRWIGTVVRINKSETTLSSGEKTPTYDVASYGYSGPRSGILSGGESLLYSETPYYLSDSEEDTAQGSSAKHLVNTRFYTVSLVDADYRGRNLVTTSPTYQINRDFVKAYTLENGKTAYFVSDPQTFRIDQSLTGPYDSGVYMDETPYDPERGTDAASSGEWVSHAFNNTHHLVSFSPTYCMIEDIAKDRPVTSYLTQDGTGSWLPSMYDCKQHENGTVPKVYTHFINSNGDEFPVTAYKQSAKDILYVRNQYPQGEEELLTPSEVTQLVNSSRYQELKAELSQRFRWSEPYSILY